MEPVALKTSARSMSVTEVLHVVYQHYTTTSCLPCRNWQMHAPRFANTRVARTSRSLDDGNIEIQNSASVPTISSSGHPLEVACPRRNRALMETNVSTKDCVHKLALPLISLDLYVKSASVLGMRRLGKRLGTPAPNWSRKRTRWTRSCSLTLRTEYISKAITQ